MYQVHVLVDYTNDDFELAPILKSGYVALLLDDSRSSALRVYKPVLGPYYLLYLVPQQSPSILP